MLTSIKHSIESDAYLGRLLALLDIKSATFGCLPPHFTLTAISEEDRDTAIGYVFGDIQGDGASRMAPFLLARLLFADDWLRETLPAKHPLWLSQYGQLDPETIARLKCDISLKNVSGSALQLTPIGVPLTTELLLQNEELSQQLKEVAKLFTEQLKGIQAEVNEVKHGITDLHDELPDHAVSLDWSRGRERADQWAQRLGVEITDRIEQKLSAMLTNHLPCASAAATGSVPAPPSASRNAMARTFKTFLWPDGQSRAVPHNFRITRAVLLSVAWQR